MSAKYKQLVKAYSDEIAKVQRLKEREKAAGEAVRAHMKATGEDDEVAHFLQERRLYDAWQAAEADYLVGLVDLTEKISLEYAGVPFDKSFHASVDAFFREAGLTE